MSSPDRTHDQIKAVAPDLNLRDLPRLEDDLAQLDHASLEQQLASLIRRMRGEPDALAERLRAIVPEWARVTAHLVLVRELGSDVGARVGASAFGDALAPPPAAVPPLPLSPDERGALAPLQHLAAQIVALLEWTALEPLLLLDRLAFADEDVARGALSLLRHQRLPNQGRTAFELVDAVCDGAASELMAGRVPLPIQLLRTFGRDATDVSVTLDSAAPGGAGGVAVDGQVHLAPGRATSDDEGRWRLGHEVAHVLQQRRGGASGGAMISPEHRAAVEDEATAAGHAFVLGHPFKVLGMAPAGVPLYDSTWEKFSKAATAHDKDAVKESLTTLTRADKAKALESKQKQVMTDALNALGEDEGPTAMKATFARNFAQGLKYYVDVTGPEKFVGKWFTVTSEKFLPGARAIAATTGLKEKKEVADLVMAMPESDAKAQKTMALEKSLVTWLKGTHPGDYIDKVFPKLVDDHTSLADVYKASKATAEWMQSDKTKFEDLGFTKSKERLSDYIAGFLKIDDAGFLLEKGATEDARVNGAIRKAKLFESFLKANPIQDAIPVRGAMETGFWNMYLWLETVPQRILAFKKLYKTPLDTKGSPEFTAPDLKLTLNVNSRPVNSKGKTAREDSPTALRTFELYADFKVKYTTAAPNAVQFDQMMGQFKLMPRAHINAVSHLVTGTGKTTSGVKFTKLKDTATGVYGALPPGFPNKWQTSTGTTGTSFYVTSVDTVLMNVTAKTGNGLTFDQDYIPGDVEGLDAAGKEIVVPQAAGGDNSANSLSYFQNHATHEMGHSIGARSFNYKDGAGASQNSVSGDSFAKTWSDWQKIGRDAVKTQYWTSGLATAPAAATDKNWVHPDAASTYLLDCCAFGHFGPTFLPARQNPDGPWKGLDIWNALKVQYSAELLTKYVAATLGRGAHTYDMLNFPPTKDRVYMWSGSDGSFVSYKKEVYEQRTKLSWYGMSHYREMFAEMYTNNYTGRALPTGTADFFGKLDKATDFAKVDRADDQNNMTTVTVAGGPGAMADAAKKVMASQIKPWP